jgi:integrase
MSLEKRAGSPYWYARFQVAGVRYLRSSGTADKREAAAWERAERARIKAASDAGKRERAKPMSVATAMGRYWHETGQYQKGGHVLRHLDWLQDRLGKKTLVRDVTTREVAALVAQRRADGVSNATVNRSVVEPLRRVLNRARDLWLEPEIQRIGWSVLKLKEQQGKPREASVSEERAILASAREEYRPAIRFAILSGRDVDFGTMTITVMGKGDKVAGVPLTDVMARLLRPLRGQHFEFVFTYERRRIRKGEPKPGERVPIPPTNLYRRFKEACEAAGVNDLRFHDLRHTAGSRITRAGGLRTAKDALRHENIATTMRYSHVQDGDVRAAMERAAHQVVSEGGISDDVETTNASNNKRMTR